MQTYQLLCLALLLIAGGATAPRSCRSRLRILYPHLFTHCECRYSDWSSWVLVPDSFANDASGKCESGRFYVERRTRSALGHQCQEEETRSVCVPALEDLIIINLGLGSTNTVPQEVIRQGITKPQRPQIPQRPQGPPGPPGIQIVLHGYHIPQTLPPTPAACPNSIKKPGPICENMWYRRGFGKRSVDIKSKNKKSESHVRKSFKQAEKEPIQFDRNEHGRRFRRHTQKCEPKDTQYVLFVLDTSGSIGLTNFKKMTEAIGNLTALFCKPIKVAVMTFNHKFHLEFCFDCYDYSDVFGFIDAKEAIENIRYRSGWTHTGGAAQCVCRELIDSSCGLPSDPKPCVDVIFITDGISNDPNLEICQTIKCLHNHTIDVNTYSLGIDNYDEDELKCIQESTNEFSAFRYDSFDEFYDSVKKIVSQLIYDENTNHTCTYADQKFGTENPEDAK